MEGYTARKSSMLSPVSRKSMSVCTGTRVCAKQGVPCMTALSMVTTPASALFCSGVIAFLMIRDDRDWANQEASILANANPRGDKAPEKCDLIQSDGL